MADNGNLLNLMKKIAAENNYVNPDIQISPISTGGANYSSSLYLIKIKSQGKEDLRLFAKIAATREKMREQVIMQPYDNERFAYAELLKVYREIEETNNVPEEHKLALPKFYGADSTHLQETLVLEDLTCQGFTLHNRLEPISWEYAAKATIELAKFHALSFAFQHKDPSNFNKVANMLPRGMFTDTKENHAFYNISTKSALESVREENRPKLQKFLDRLSLADFGKSYGTQQRPIIIHGDFRPSNMLHRHKNDGTLDLIVVDYQTLQAGSPVIDLLYLIFSGTDGQFRSKHYQELVELYRSQLGDALTRLGLDLESVYPRKEFEFELKEKLPFGLHMSALVLASLLMTEESAPEVDLDSMVSLANIRTGDHYVRRINEIVDDYVAWGVLE